MARPRELEPREGGPCRPLPEVGRWRGKGENAERVPLAGPRRYPGVVVQSQRAKCVAAFSGRTHHNSLTCPRDFTRFAGADAIHRPAVCRARIQTPCDAAGSPSEGRVMRVLVTGGAGFIGSHLAETLLKRGDEVWVLGDLSTGRDRKSV